MIWLWIILAVLGLIIGLSCLLVAMLMTAVPYQRSAGPDPIEIGALALVGAVLVVAGVVALVVF